MCDATSAPGGRYSAFTLANIHRAPQWPLLTTEQQEAVRVVGRILPFRTNSYVMDELIDWSQVPHDPIYQLTFPQPGMIDATDYRKVAELLRKDAEPEHLAEVANDIRLRLNPHPAGQLTHNVPQLNGRPLAGMQHKYRETVLFFPAAGQTCHAYCTYCFRWAQFVGLPEIKFEARETDDLVAYLLAHPEVSDLLVTGGDPMIMRASVLRRYLEPLLNPKLEHLTNIRIGSKSLTYWPTRYLTDPDAASMLHLFEELIAAGKHLTFMAHFSHPAELQTSTLERAVRNIRATGAEIRTQAPLVRHINDQAETWRDKWRREVSLGLIPYYMFVERDTGPKRYFEVPLFRAQQIFKEAYAQVSGLARTVRGPSMSALPGKVRVVGVSEVRGERIFVLEFLQARDPNWVGQPFFAHYDQQAVWLNQLKPAFGADRFFYQQAPAKMLA